MALPPPPPCLLPAVPSPQPLNTNIAGVQMADEDKLQDNLGLLDARKKAVYSDSRDMELFRKVGGRAESPVRRPLAAPVSQETPRPDAISASGQDA